MQGQFRQSVRKGSAPGHGRDKYSRQILVAAEGARQRPTDLGDFQRMGEAGAEVVTFKVDEYLRLVLSRRRGGVENPIPVTLEGGTVVRFVIQIGASCKSLLRIP